MKDVEHILSCLEKTPEILAGLLSDIPGELLKARRIESAWSIHEHACHIATGDRIGFLDRLDQFLNEECPVFAPLSGESFPPDHLIKMDLEQALNGFLKDRAELAQRMKSLDESLWEKEGKHPEYVRFTPYIMLRHRLMHDHLHLYRIEELWLTREHGLRGH
jgi:hypothetical protein